MKKILLLLLLLVVSGGAMAIQFGNEIHNPSIVSDSFKMITNPELDSQFFLQFQLADDNGIPLDNYHTELRILDSRGVLVYPDTSEGGSRFADPIAVFFRDTLSFSDSNGFVNYSFILPSCNAINQTYCFQLDQNYTVTVTGKNIFREEFFTTTINSIETNWLGDTMRFVNVNSQSLLIISVSLGFIIFLVTLVFVRKRGGK